MKGFASKVIGKEVFVWHYRKDGKYIEANTRKVGAEREFYGNPSGVFVDDQITKIEQEHSQIFDRLRAKPTSGRVTDPKFPELIAHLSVRTRFLRQSITDSLEFFLDHLVARVTHPASLRLIFRGPMVKEQLVIELTRQGLGEEQINALVPLIEPLLPAILEDSIPNVLQHVTSFRDLAQIKFPEAIQEAHINALAKNPDLRERSDRYRSFNWHLFVQETPLLLGDTICVFETEPHRTLRPVDDVDAVRRVYLPVSKDRILVGTPYQASPRLEPRSLNKAIARCSYEYFVSGVELKQDSSLPKSIGWWSGILSPSELTTIGDQVGLT